MKKPYFWVYAFCLVLFAVLCYLASQFSTFPGDRTISAWLQEAVPQVLVPATEAITYLGFAVPAVITVALLVIVLLFINRRLEATFMVVLPTIAGLFNEMMKLVVDRPRPDDILWGRSFPSGHTTYAVVLGGFIFYLAPRLSNRPVIIWAIRSLMVLFILTMGVSRVSLVAHWPSDVLGSLILGGLVLVPCIILFERYYKDNQREPEVEDARAP